jgi:hypothetical protein
MLHTGRGASDDLRGPDARGGHSRAKRGCERSERPSREARCPKEGGGALSMILSLCHPHSAYEQLWKAKARRILGQWVGVGVGWVLKYSFCLMLFFCSQPICSCRAQKLFELKWKEQENKNKITILNFTII